MVKHKKVCIDIDGCLADFILGFTTLAHSIYPDVPVTKTTEQPSWLGYPGMTLEQSDATWVSVNNSSRFWLNLDPLVSAEELDKIRRLQGVADVYFCTARSGLKAKSQTEAWLVAKGLRLPTVVLCKNKGEFAKAVGIDYTIDDKAANASCIDWVTEGRTKSYLLNRPYNQVPSEFLGSGVRRVDTVEQFLEAINNG